MHLFDFSHHAKSSDKGTTDHWIQKSIKWIFNSGLFWAVRAAEKKKSKLP